MAGSPTQEFWTNLNFMKKGFPHVIHLSPGEQLRESSSSYPVLQEIHQNFHGTYS